MKFTFHIVTLVCLVRFISPVPIQPSADPDDPSFLLPDNLSPQAYSLNLTVYLDKLQDERAFYDGRVDILLTVIEDATSISLNMYDNIAINGAQLALMSDPPIKTNDKNNGDGTGIQGGNLKKLGPKADDDLLADGDPVYNPITQIVTLNLKEGKSLLKGAQYALRLDFRAEHRNDLAGFYRSSYRDSSGKIHRLLTTDLEPTSARSVFPCFDEPRFKALNLIKVRVGTEFVNDLGYHVLSNTPLEYIDVDGDYTVFHFEGTPKKISTYLIAIIISDFKGSEPATTFNDGKPFRTWGRPRYIDNKEDQLSQLAGPAVLEIMTKNTGIEFQFPKVDQAGIPDFSAGAMENWGLITYRENYLFYDEDNDSENQKEGVVSVTAHELSHQWFGDYVTLHSWDDIWLNEGFADYFEYHATAEINVPGLNTADWNLIEEFVLSELQGVFTTDGFSDSRPLTSQASDPDVIGDHFDDITYSKGGSVIRMWSHILGRNIFYGGLNKYLLANAEENGTPEELLNAFETAAAEAPQEQRPVLPTDTTVSEAFADWHLEAGYPVLNVERTGNNTYTLTQERFLYDDDEGNQFNTKWNIPITYSTSENIQFEKTSPVTWLRKVDQSSELVVGPGNVQKPEWLVVNNQETGYYRVNYDEENWEALRTILENNPGIIDPINRAQIIDDALNLGRSTKKNYLNYSTALSLTKYLINEHHYIPWAAALNGFSFLDTKLYNDASYKYLKQHVLQGVEARYKELGLKVNIKDSHLQRLLRILIADWACKLGHPQCVADAKVLYESNDIPADVKSITYCTVVRNGDQTVFEDIWAKFTKSDRNLDQTMLLSALGCSKDETLLNELLLETIKRDSKIRKQDCSEVFLAASRGNPENVKIVLAFLKNHLEDIAENYGGRKPLRKLINELANLVVSEDDIQSLKEILDSISANQNPKVRSAAKIVSLAKNLIAHSQNWLATKHASVTSWLRTTYKDHPTF